ncbi:MAG TPA: XRE family transcriptional regulator [Gammaproteobacteria bacterium]|nr:XRE family transcriptional regulator [Gammaproteobacteria bacterium]
MPQSTELIQLLKRNLKANGLTYADVAKGLALSQASIKRMFASGHFTLDRLEQVCELAHMNLSDLVHQLDESQYRVTRLTADQENELVTDLQMLLIAVCVRSHWSLDEIVRVYQLSEHDVIRHLARLDRLGLIELLPGNRIRLLVAHDFQWIPGGPIERFYEERIQNEFFASTFAADNAFRVFASGLLSKESQALLCRRLHSLSREVATMIEEDSSLPLHQRHSTGMVLAVRPWELSVFTDLQRVATEKPGGT